MMDYS